MAMLAEPRRKTKWTLNPRGKFWSEDSNKFGQKLLEKMGWKEGKGLGANEQGITSHIHVQVKSDNTGVGFKGKDTDWCKHQSQFDEILASLSQSMDGVGSHVPSESLEERSKASKARLHYHKFTRGKDVSKYSSKDLGCILGVQGEKPQTDYSEDLGKVEDIGTKDDSFGVKTIVGGSIDDYLNRKKTSRNHLKTTEREDGWEEDSGCKKRKAEGDMEKRVSDVEDGETGAPYREGEVIKVRKKIKCDGEEEMSGKASNLLAYTDELELIEGNVTEHVVDLEKTEKKRGARRKKSEVLNLECVDESPGGHAIAELEMDSLSKSMTENKKRKRKIVLLDEFKDNLPNVEINADNMKGEQYFCKNGIVENGAGGKGNDVDRRKKKKHKTLEGLGCVSSELADGIFSLEHMIIPLIGTHDDSARKSTKKSKKNKSSDVVETEKYDHSLSTDTDITLGDINHSVERATKEKVIEADELSSEKIGISREVKRLAKLKKMKKRKVKSELHQKPSYHSCLNRKECDEVIVDSSIKMFSGANLSYVKGYGTEPH